MPVGSERSEVEKLYHDAFPIEERKPFEMVLAGIEQEKMECYVLENDGRFVGLAFFILGEPFDILDYFAIDPDRRSEGLGSLALALLRETRERPFLVEIESTKQNNSQEKERRKAFYIKNGFCDGDIEVELFGVPMELLSSQLTFTFEQYEKIMKKYFEKNISKWIKSI